MIVHYGLESWRPGPEIQTAATLGNFDGVHLGHQIILSRVKSRALAENLTAVILTFDPIPKKVLSPETAPPLIQTIDRKTSEIRAQRNGSRCDYSVFA